MRIVFFFVLLISAIFFHFLFFCMCAVLYGLRWRGYEIIFIAGGIDAYFGSSVAVPYYTLACILVVVVLEWLKPKLSWHAH